MEVDITIAAELRSTERALSYSCQVADAFVNRPGGGQRTGGGDRRNL